MRRTAVGHFECGVCRQIAYTATGARRMQLSTCGGAIHRSIHQTHQLRLSHGVTWCSACAAFSTRWPRQLLAACPRRPRSQAQRNVLRRLMQGLTPTSAAYFADAACAKGRPAATTDNIIDIITAAGALHDPPASPRVHQGLQEGAGGHDQMQGARHREDADVFDHGRQSSRSPRVTRRRRITRTCGECPHRREQRAC